MTSIKIRSLDFSIQMRGYNGARQALEKEASRLRNKGFTIVAITVDENCWTLFFEFND